MLCVISSVDGIALNEGLKEAPKRAKIRNITTNRFSLFVFQRMNDTVSSDIVQDLKKNSVKELSMKRKKIVSRHAFIDSI